MTPSDKTTAYALDYFEKFRCIGSKCESNCCNSWKILIDENTLDKYTALNDSSNDFYFQHIIPGDQGEHFIQLNEAGFCPYLNDQNLCGMVSKYGDSILSDTCRVYPRTGKYLEHLDTLFASIYLSCPQAVKLGILRKKKLKFLKLPTVNVTVSINHRMSDYHRPEIHNQCLLAIHNGMVQICQSHQHTLSERLTALLLLSSFGSKLNPVELPEDAYSFLQETENMLSRGLDDLPPLNTNLPNQFKIFLDLTEGLVARKQTKQGLPATRHFFDVIDNSFKGFEIETFSLINEQHLKNYVYSIKKYIKPFVNKSPYVFDNLLAHQIITEHFPFPVKNTPPIEQLINVIVLFTLIRGLLAGRALLQKEISEEAITEIIHITYRELQHNPSTLEFINEYIKKLGAESPAQLFTLFSI